MSTRPKQKVWLSRTRSGVPGIFTGNTLVWSINEDDFVRFTANPTLFAEYAAKYGFDVDETRNLDLLIAVQQQQGLRRELISNVMGFYDFSSEEWDSIPSAVQDKIIHVYTTL